VGRRHLDLGDLALARHSVFVTVKFLQYTRLRIIIYYLPPSSGTRSLERESNRAFTHPTTTTTMSHTACPSDPTAAAALPAQHEYPDKTSSVATTVQVTADAATRVLTQMASILGTSVQAPLDSVCMGRLLPYPEVQGECPSPVSDPPRSKKARTTDGGDEKGTETDRERESEEREKRGTDGNGSPALAVAGAVFSASDVAVAVAVSTPPAKATGAPKHTEAAAQSRFTGVTMHKRSRRWEAHCWVNSLKKQVYLGGYATQELAAEAYDIIAVKIRGAKAKTNFPLENYTEAMRALQGLSIEQVIASVKRESDSFIRGVIKYRGVSRAAMNSPLFEARIGVLDHHVYIGNFPTAMEAAKAYDRALIRCKGPRTTTNFNSNEYPDAINDHRLLRELLGRGDPRAKAMIHGADKDHVRAFETYAKGGMKAIEAVWGRQRDR